MSILPSLPTPGFLKMYMLWTTTGSSNPNWKQHSLTLSSKVILLKTGFNSCKAWPILFNDNSGSTFNSPFGPKAPAS